MATSAELNGRWLNPRASLQMGLGAIELAGDESAPYSLWLAHLWSTSSHAALGDPDDAQKHAAESMTAAERLRTRSQLLDALWANALLSHVKGDWR